MITEKVLGVYASVWGMPDAQAAPWYDKSAAEWGIDTFEIPLFAGAPLGTGLVDVFVKHGAALVVTLVAHTVGASQKDRAYGLASTEEPSRRAALLDAYSIVQQCRELSRRGIRIRHVVLQTGQRIGATIPHAIAFSQSLIELRGLLEKTLPDCGLLVEPADTRPADHPIPVPGSKKSSLGLSELIEVLSAINRQGANPSVGLMVNWGRALVNGDVPLANLERILRSSVPLGGVILSGAGASPDGLRDSHNSHLDPQSGFTAEDARSCAQLLKSSTEPIFLGMKCSRANSQGELTIDQALSAQAKLLQEIA